MIKEKNNQRIFRHLGKSFICDDIDIDDLLHSVKDRKKKRENKKLYVALEIMYHIIGFSVGQLTLQPTLFTIKR